MLPNRAIIALLIILICGAFPAPAPAAAQGAGGLGVQPFLDAQPGFLKEYEEAGRSAATIIEGAALYYGISPQLHLALLEATASLLSEARPPAEDLRRPFGRGGPVGFAAQIEWASRELRAGLGPYSQPPTVRFSDGVTLTLSLDQAPEGVAVQRFLAHGRTEAAWQAAVQRFGEAFQLYFANELIRYGAAPAPAPAAPEAAARPPGGFTLLQPWPAGTRVVHLAYFDHVYPTVDSGDDGNGYVVNYRGEGNVQYDGHDGHDYYFPDQPVGTPILAAAAGLAYARTHRGYGVVILHPDGYETVYWHLAGFAPIFADLIDSDRPVPVRAGELLGVSGATGFVRGTPHLHFEVRRYGRQIDPYGWYGPGPDPCVSYAACLAGQWLWDSALAGSYDFTPPGGAAADGASAAAAGAEAASAQTAALSDHGRAGAGEALPVATPRQGSAAARPGQMAWSGPGAGTATAGQGDTTPPVGTLAVNPPADLLFGAGFDGHVVQGVGRGFPVLYGQQRFTPGRAGEALVLGSAGLTYPVAGNLQATAGTISLWAELPASYPASRIPRHYLLAASANPDGAPVYSNTLALRRDQAGPDGDPAWVFWTTAADEASRNLLAAPDSLGAGWHHFAITWDAATGVKQLYLDGQLAAEATGVALPGTLGEVLQLGRFTYGGWHSGAALDDLAIFSRALTPAEVAALAAQAGAAAEPPLIAGRRVRLDTNAIDDQGGIVAVQIGLNGVFTDPQPYYDAYQWLLPAAPGDHELAVRYVDRAGNTTTVTRTIRLAPAAGATIYLPQLSR